MSWWSGIGAGLGIMAVHIALRVLTHRLALKCAGGPLFLFVELGGLGGRTIVLLVAMVLVLALAPVHKAAFAGTVLFLLVLSIIVETGLVARRLRT